jgi:hypothetical protein
MFQLSWISRGMLFFITTPNKQAAYNLFAQLPAECGARLWHTANKRCSLIA